MRELWRVRWILTDEHKVPTLEKQFSYAREQAYRLAAILDSLQIEALAAQSNRMKMLKEKIEAMKTYHRPMEEWPDDPHPEYILKSEVLAEIDKEELSK